MGEKVLKGGKEKRDRKEEEGSVWEKQKKAFYEEKDVSVK